MTKCSCAVLSAKSAPLPQDRATTIGESQGGTSIALAHRLSPE